MLLPLTIDKETVDSCDRECPFNDRGEVCTLFNQSLDISGMGDEHTMYACIGCKTMFTKYLARNSR